MVYAIDSSALIALLQKESGKEIVESIFSDPNNQCYMHAINLCEVYYDYIRRSDISTARKIIQEASELLTVRNDIDRDFWQEAGEYKANLRRISLADCLCITLANRIGGTVVTTDHHEFDAIHEKGIITVKFIR